MTADQAGNSLDLKKLRHDISNALGTLQTTVAEIRPHTTGADDAFELHEMALERLRRVLATIDEFAARRA